jgi:hypothetical protein
MATSLESQDPRELVRNVRCTRRLQNISRNVPLANSRVRVLRFNGFLYLSIRVIYRACADRFLLKSIISFFTQMKEFIEQVRYKELKLSP